MTAVAITPPEGSGMNDFAETNPDKFDVAIAEQHSMTLPQDWPKREKTCSCNLFYILQRAYDQLIHDVALKIRRSFVLDKLIFWRRWSNSCRYL